MTISTEKIRNIAIIAHVDHGKTTLVDQLLKQAGTFRSNEATADRMMDSMDLERERGITIAAKNTAVLYKDYKINIVDTPGHADFGGEVERILAMVDGCCLLVDAAEGPLPQTRFVLRKALAQNMRVMVVVNKIDRQDARPQEVLNEIFNLFIDLEANDEQCDFPYIFAIARDGKAFAKLEDRNDPEANLQVLFDKVIEIMPHPRVEPEKPLQMLISNLSYSDYLGRLAVGRVVAGKLKVGETAAVVGVNAKGESQVKPFKIQGLFTYHGLKQVPVDEVVAGDIAVLAGIEEVNLGDTIAAAPGPGTPAANRWDPASLALPRPTIDEPTLKIEWYVNTSPLAGREGQHVTSRKLRDRLEKETLTNVALRFQETDNADRFMMMGRGELQMAILAETLRREGFEFALGQPQILIKEENGVKMEPVELAILDIPEFSQGTITQMFQQRKGILQNIVNRGSGRVRLEIQIPARGLIGLRNRVMTESRGEGLFNVISAGYQEMKGEIPNRLNGALVSDRAGESNAYALEGLQERGILFIGHATQVYEGMIVGECAKDNDLDLNVCKSKQLTNFRTVNKDDAIVLTPPKLMTIERGMEWIADDELLEITPKSIRARKKVLEKNRRPK